MALLFPGAKDIASENAIFPEWLASLGGAILRHLAAFYENIDRARTRLLSRNSAACLASRRVWILVVVRNESRTI
jgi:hypothetical protein